MKKESVVKKIDEYVNEQKRYRDEAREYEMWNLELACVRRIDAATEIRQIILDMGDGE